MPQKDFISCPMRQVLGLDLVEIVERVLQRELSHAAEPYGEGELAQLGFGQPTGAQALSAIGQRGRHAVDHAESIEERSERPRVLLRLVRAVDVQAEVGPAGPQRLAD